MTRLWTLRLRQFASQSPFLVLACLLIVAAGGGWAAHSALDPETRTETTAVSAWTTETDYEHSAVIEKRNPVFPVNATVDNRSAYFRTVSPTLDGAYTFTYGAQARGDVVAATTVVLAVRNVDRRDGTVYWRVSEPLADARNASVAPGEVVRVPFSVNVSTLRGRIADVNSRLGSAPGTTEIRIVSRTTVSGTIDGNAVEAERGDEMTIELREETPVYRVADDDPRLEVVEETESTDVPVRPTPVRLAVSILALCLPVVAFAGVALAHRRGSLALTGSERARLKRAEFADWITDGTVSEAVAARPGVAVDSLEGLVDVAIDTHNRVIYDESRRSYVVVHRDVRYRYVPDDAADGGGNAGSDR